MAPASRQPAQPGGGLVALAVWAVVLGTAVCVFAALGSLGASATASAVIGIPLCVILVYGAGQLARRVRVRRGGVPVRREAQVVDHEAVERTLWGVRGLGVTWLTRGSAYWLRRVLIWLGWMAGTVLVVAMTVGIISGATHTPAARAMVSAIVVTVNLVVFIGLLTVGWPTTARLRAKPASGKTPPGLAAAAGIGLIGSRSLATALVPVLLLGATGVMLAMLVLSSLYQLPQEKAMALRRTDVAARTRRHR